VTTIACDGKSIAGDGLITSGDSIFGYRAKKVFEISNGRLVGVAGNAFQIRKFVEWLDRGGKLPELDDDTEALVLERDGTCKTYNYQGNWWEEELPTGSGRDHAIAAMDAGADAQKAIEIASLRDTCTGGDVMVLKLKKRTRV
jgi:ATP-dependent protease HslVU (ClpYQ) peptidase subunit